MSLKHTVSDIRIVEYTGHVVSTVLCLYYVTGDIATKVLEPIKTELTLNLSGACLIQDTVHGVWHRRVIERSHRETGILVMHLKVGYGRLFRFPLYTICPMVKGGCGRCARSYTSVCDG